MPIRSQSFVGQYKTFFIASHLLKAIITSDSAANCYEKTARNQSLTRGQNENCQYIGYSFSII
jgi:hypothetical protein